MQIDQSRSVVATPHTPLQDMGLNRWRRQTRSWTGMVAAGLLVGLLQACGQRGPLVLPPPAKAVSASIAAASAPSAPR